MTKNNDKLSNFKFHFLLFCNGFLIYNILGGNQRNTDRKRAAARQAKNAGKKKNKKPGKGAELKKRQQKLRIYSMIYINIYYIIL